MLQFSLNIESATTTKFHQENVTGLREAIWQVNKPNGQASIDRLEKPIEIDPELWISRRNSKTDPVKTVSIKNFWTFEPSSQTSWRQTPLFLSLSVQLFTSAFSVKEIREVDLKIFSVWSFGLQSSPKDKVKPPQTDTDSHSKMKGFSKVKFLSIIGLLGQKFDFATLQFERSFAQRFKSSLAMFLITSFPFKYYVSMFFKQDDPVQLKIGSACILICKLVWHKLWLLIH